MDRTSRIGVFICGLGLLILYFYSMPPPAKPGSGPATPVTASTPAKALGTPTLSAAPTATSAAQPTSVPSVPEVTSVLENASLKVNLTSNGAAITDIELKQHKDGDGHVMLNERAHSNVLALDGWPGANGFQVTQSSPYGITYTTNLPNGVKWDRTYAFGSNHETDIGLSGALRKFSRKIAAWMGHPPGAPLIYTLDVKDSLTNSSAADIVLPPYSLSVGRAQPLIVRKHYQSISDQYLGSGWYTSKFYITTVGQFNPGYVPIIGIKTSDGKDVINSTSISDQPLRWLGVENQFFAVLLTPSSDHLIQHADIRCYNQRDADGYVISTRDGLARDEEGYLLPGLEPDIEAAGHFPAVTVPAGQTVTFNYSLYAGPKEFNRLDALGDDQGALMNYDGVLPFSLLIVPMLTVLKFWYMLFHNYGIAIILLTLMIKAITWPLQSFANHSGKRMQALAPKLKELQAKYKEQPEKLQTETFAMYKEYGVNPFGGCLPALVQMPVFFSLYFMLQNAVELRGQHFLWIHDLTQPDSVATFTLPFILPLIGGHFSLNLLPILVTGLTMVMMRMTPQIGDPAQAKIAQFMPLIFLFIFYNFAAALSLYYVINNAVSIIQIYRNLKKPLPELVRKTSKKK
jgi:YidC/Oxa1 family membrane protein insertase